MLAAVLDLIAFLTVIGFGIALIAAVASSVRAESERHGQDNQRALMRGSSCAADGRQLRSSQGYVRNLR
jgi:hypothetical protein